MCAKEAKAPWSQLTKKSFSRMKASIIKVRVALAEVFNDDVDKNNDASGLVMLEGLGYCISTTELHKVGGFDYLADLMRPDTLQNLGVGGFGALAHFRHKK
jgi:hypothetical protein